MTAQDKLNRIVEDCDLALDYIEHEIGCHDFLQNWVNHKKKHDAKEHIAAWLKDIQVEDADVILILQFIDSLAEKGTKWLAPKPELDEF